MNISSSSDTTRIDELYRAEWGSLVRAAFLMVGSRELAEEIVQEAFLRLHQGGDRIANPGGYVRVSVVNACRSAHRHRAVVERTPLHRTEPIFDSHDELSDALAKLSWSQHAALILRYHLDLPESAIAQALRCRPSTVRSTISRALTLLRKELS